MLRVPGAARATPQSDGLPELVGRCAAGDRAAERDVLARLTPAIRLFAQRRLRGSDAQDFVQDATLLLVSALRDGRVTDAEQTGSFALGICRNLARDRARAAERRSELWERFGPREEDATEGPGHAAHVSRTMLEDCFGQLTPRTRALVQRAYVDGETNGEIAEAMSLSEGNVRVIRHRALQQLRTCLEQPSYWSRR